MRLSSITTGIAGLSLMLAACAGSSTVTQTVTAVETVTAPAEASPTPTPTPAPTPTPTPTAERDNTFVMPDVVGENLQEAQDYLQSLGSYLMDQEDALGAGRLQLLDRNWYVCSQKPSPGARVPTSTIVTLYSVKNNESCP